MTLERLIQRRIELRSAFREAHKECVEACRRKSDLEKRIVIISESIRRLRDGGNDAAVQMEENP